MAQLTYGEESTPRIQSYHLVELEFTMVIPTAHGPNEVEEWAIAAAAAAWDKDIRSSSYPVVMATIEYNGSHLHAVDSYRRLEQQLVKVTLRWEVEKQ